jgi:hypothetical protein
MNANLVQNLRDKLQKRYRRLNGLGFQLFGSALKQFWGFVHSQPVFVGIIDELRPRFPALEATAERQATTRQAIVCDDENENVAFSYLVLKRCVEATQQQMLEVRIGQNLTTVNHHDNAVEAFRVAFVEPLYEYLDEQTNDQRAILSLLRRYKHKCESFQRRQLYAAWNADTSKGEEILAFHLYEYLHDQGVEVTIEPYSESGKVDMIAAQNSDDPLVADAKIFNPEKGKGKPYICHGFHQIYQYTLDYNEPFGYLVIFKTCPEDLKFTLEGQEQSVPFITHNHKTIFLITIDIYPHEQSASKRGYLKVYSLTPDELVRSAEGDGVAAELEAT